MASLSKFAFALIGTATLFANISATAVQAKSGGNGHGEHHGHHSENQGHHGENHGNHGGHHGPSHDGTHGPAPTGQTKPFKPNPLATTTAENLKPMVSNPSHTRPGPTGQTKPFKPNPLATTTAENLKPMVSNPSHIRPGNFRPAKTPTLVIGDHRTPVRPPLGPKTPVISDHRTSLPLGAHGSSIVKPNPLIPAGAGGSLASTFPK
jgi:hypothetical protein